MEPISIGKQQFIIKDGVWIDKKSKIPADKKLAKILDKARELSREETGNENIPDTISDIKDALNQISGLIENSNLKDDVLESTSKTDKIKPKSKNQNKSTQPKFVSDTKDKSLGFIKEVLSTASPFITKNYNKTIFGNLSAFDAKFSKQQNKNKLSEKDAEKKTVKKTEDKLEKITSLLSKIDKNLSVGKKDSKEETRESKQDKKQSSNVVTKNYNKTIFGNLKANIRSGVLGQRDKETGELLQTGFIRDVIETSSPFIGKNLLRARDEARQKKYSDDVSNKTKLEKLIDRVLEKNVASPDTQFEKSIENATQRKETVAPQQSTINAIITDFTDGALDKLKGALLKETKSQDNTPGGNILDLASSIIPSAKGILGTGLSKIGKFVGMKPSIKGLRLNSAGKVVDSSGKFVSAEKSKLFLESQNKTIKPGIFESAKNILSKGGTKEAAKEAGKSGIKKAGLKTLAKFGGKSAVKKIPIVGLGAGLIFGASKLLKGDYTGAGLEVASGAASLVPGIGTAASVAIDAGIAARDSGVLSKEENSKKSVGISVQTPMPIQRNDSLSSKTANLAISSKQVANMKERAATKQPAPIIASKSNTVVNNSSKQSTTINGPTIPDRGSLGKIRY